MTFINAYSISSNRSYHVPLNVPAVVNNTLIILCVCLTLYINSSFTLFSSTITNGMIQAITSLMIIIARVIHIEKWSHFYDCRHNDAPSWIFYFPRFHSIVLVGLQYKVRPKCISFRSKFLATALLSAHHGVNLPPLRQKTKAQCGEYNNNDASTNKGWLTVNVLGLTISQRTRLLCA